MKRIWIVLLSCFSLYAFEPQSTGVLLLHGKGGTPLKTWEHFQGALEKEGYVVMAKEMPWSKNRYLDKTYEASLDEIKASIEELKTKGVKQIVLIGHSLGGNVSIAYGSLQPLDALVILAPGHNPNRLASYFKPSLERAKALIDEGKGASIESFADTSAKKQLMQEMRADIYYSFFSLDGLGSMETRAKYIPNTLPVLYVVGKNDPLTEKNGMHTFDAIPKTPKTQYVTVSADHFGAVNASVEEVLTWLKSL